MVVAFQGDKLAGVKDVYNLEDMMSVVWIDPTSKCIFIN